MLFRAPKTRKFTYSPSYYDEEKDHEEALKRRINFHQGRRYMPKRRPFVGLIIILIIAVLLLSQLNKMRNKVPEKIELENMEIVK